jgi:hypothetical protein
MKGYELCATTIIPTSTDEARAIEITAAMDRANSSDFIDVI